MNTIMAMQNPPRLLYFFPFLLLLLSSCQSNAPKSEEKIERYDQGQIKRRTQLVDGKRDGKMTDYYPDGNMRGERYFTNGQQTGRTVWYFRSGKVKEVQYFANNEKQGGDTLWYETGEVQYTVDFQDSKKNGYFRKWSKEGEIVIEARYARDSLLEVTKGMLHAGDVMETDTTQKLREATIHDASGG